MKKPRLPAPARSTALPPAALPQVTGGLFDTLGKVMERYDQSAKNVIASMRG